MAKKKKWIQAASASIKKRGTEGVCTGPKFGGPTCPPGSKRYNLAKVFKGMAKKKKKAAWGSMIHAKKGYYNVTAGTTGESGIKELLKAIKAGHISGVIPHSARKHATGAMIHAKDSKYIQRAKDRHPPLNERGQKTKEKDLKKNDDWKYRTGPIRIDKRFMFDKRFLKKDPRMMREGGMLKAKTSAFAETHAANWAKRRGAATTGMKIAGAGTAYKSPGWINKSLNKLKNMMKLGTKSTAMGAGLAKYTGKIPKASQLKTLTKVGGRRSLMLMGGPMGAAAAAATLTPSLIEKLTKRAPGATKTKLFGIDLKGAEKSARTREALMAKRNKARNAKTGTMVRAAHGEEVLGKQQVPFNIEPASANLAEQRQGRKGAAVRGFDFKGVR